MSWNSNQLRYHHCSVLLQIDFAASLWGWVLYGAHHVCVQKYECVLCEQLWILNAAGSFCHWAIRVWWIIPCREPSKKQSLPSFLSNFTHIVTHCAVGVSCYPQCSGGSHDPPRSCSAIPGPSNIPGSPGVDQLWTQYLKPDFKGLNVHLAFWFFFFHQQVLSSSPSCLSPQGSTLLVSPKLSNGSLSPQSCWKSCKMPDQK